MSGQTADVIITVPTGFEVKVGSGNYQPAGSIPSTTTSVQVQVRLSGRVPGNSSGFVRFIHAGGTASYNVSGTTVASSAVVLAASPMNLGGFVTTRGNPSSAQTYTLTGCNLATPVTITPPSGYAVSTDGTNFSPTPLSVSLGQNPQQIFVRLTGDMSGAVNGTVANETAGASASVSVSGQVNEPPIAAPDLKTKSGEGYPAGVTSLTVTQNQYPAVTFIATNCAGVLSWTGSNGISGTGDIPASTSAIGTVTYTAVCSLIGQTGPPSTVTLVVREAANRAPIVRSPIPNQTAVAGQSYNYGIPSGTFSDPDGQTLILSASGLPDGTIFVGNSISGVPSTTGINSVTVVATDPAGLSVTTTFAITVVPSSTSNPQPPLSPNLQTQSGQGYSGGVMALTVTQNQYSSVNFIAPNCSGVLSYSGSNGLMGTGTIQAPASSIGVFTYRATCTVNNVTSEPTTVTLTVSSASIAGPQPLQLIAPSYDCRTGIFQFNTTGGNSSPISFSAVGITGSRVSNTSSLIDDVDTQLAEDIRRGRPNVMPIRLSATQSGIQITYLWDAVAACGGTVTQPPPSTTVTPPTNPDCGSPANTLEQALRMVAPTYNCQTGDITFNTTGGNGTSITYQAVGIVSETTICRNRMDAEVSMDVRNDRPNVQPFTLIARQGNQSSTFSWDARAYCRTTTSRQAIEKQSPLQVLVLNNPTEIEVAEVIITGAAEQHLQLVVSDASGRIVGQKVVEKATAIERQRLKLGTSPGLYLLQAITNHATQTVRIMRK